ncbi:MAG TPA: hypothetical protein IGS52_09380 [Oscillatoriaceae cyanobacterium M33_DOE_052]|uniref:Uncharacterized protein n=1 Tax=Planktothricoides sp. SpSt-374 TaxID=2282167 RepID=A0A7C3VKR6_9CYAN|nr:hypothetical protein [Oscillatoriaceae cyanobacterium M33_DOE_052]
MVDCRSHQLLESYHIPSPYRCFWAKAQLRTPSPRLPVSPSPRLPVPPSPRHPVPPSPGPPISPRGEKFLKWVFSSTLMSDSSREN